MWRSSKKTKSVPFKEVKTPSDRIRVLELHVAQQIQYGQNSGWAVGLLTELREIRLELESRNYIPARPGSILLEPPVPSPGSGFPFMGPSSAG